MAMTTLANLVRINDQNALDLGMSDLFDQAPALQRLAAVPASNGTLHKYLKQVTASSAAFRAENAGVAKTVSVDTSVTRTLKILDASYAADVALANGYRSGRDAYLERELRRSLKQGMFVSEKQVFQGTTYGDSAGFAGLPEETTLDATTDTAHVVNAGGSDTSTMTDCWVIRTADDGVAVVAGNDGMVEVNTDEAAIVRITDTNGAYGAFWVSAVGYQGLQVGSANGVARICNITDSKPLTDALIYQAQALFPAGMGANLIVTSRKGLNQVRASRTTYSPTGQPAPIPTATPEGVPLIVSDGVRTGGAAVS